MIVCDTGARVLSAIVDCGIISSISHDIVLGFYWLRTCNPHIYWFAYTLSVLVPGRHHILAGLPFNSIVHVELASWTLFARRLTMVQLLGSHLSVW